MLLKYKEISLKYTLLWLLSGLLMILLVIFPSLLSGISHALGFQSNMNGLMVFGVAFIIMIIMSLTSIVSKQSSKIRNLVQYTAMLEKRIRDIEHIMKEDGNSIDNHETDH
jgi:hypothetical protein